MNAPVVTDTASRVVLAASEHPDASGRDVVHPREPTRHHELWRCSCGSVQGTSGNRRPYRAPKLRTSGRAKAQLVS